MSHNPSHIMVRRGTFVFNRRVPVDVREAFGCQQVRVSLGRDRTEAEDMAGKLNEKLNQLWKGPQVRPVEVSQLVDSIKPKITTLEDGLSIYLAERSAGRGQQFEKTTKLATEILTNVAGNKSIQDYDREDARAFVSLLEASGVKTGTIRRRLNSIKAVLELAYYETGIEKRNPFAKLRIPGEGLDATKRGTFTEDQLREAYATALSSGSEIKLIVPLLGETGCRLAEVVGLRLKDVSLDDQLIQIVPHAARRLKTRASERDLPLVGAALSAVQELMERREKDQGGPLGLLFPRYERDGTILATHASNAVNKWLKRDFDGLTAHCLRHTFRDRLRAAETPVELIDEIGGWSYARTIGSGYGRGFRLDQKRKWIEAISLMLGDKHENT